jgi:hypothetical protein
MIAYLSVVSGNFVFTSGLHGIDRKFNPIGEVPPILFTGKEPNNVIQTGPEVVNNLSRKDAESRRNLALSMSLESVLKGLLIVVGDSGILPLAKESCDLNIQIGDVLIGPF